MTVHYGVPGSASGTQGSWQSIGEWYQTLAKDRLVATPEIAAKAKELAGDKTDFYDKTEAIAAFVQKQVRYFVIEMGIGGYPPPHTPAITRHPAPPTPRQTPALHSLPPAPAAHNALL